MKATLKVQNENENFATIDFLGDSIHNKGTIKSRKFSHNEREKKKEEMKTNGMTPGSIYRQALKDLDSKSYAAGNFTGCGTMRKVYSKISQTIQNEKHDYEQLNSRLLKLERKLKEEDEENSKRIGQPETFLRVFA